MQPNPYSVPTSWNFNPLANTSNLIDYDGTNEYDSSTQPYDGFSTPTSTSNWKNPTAYQSSLIAGAMQQYYGGPSEVPLYAGPTTWLANDAPTNEAGQYMPENSAYANVRPYNVATLAYDSSETSYDGGNGSSFSNWKAPTSWSPIAPGAL
jgi:hypothetical protein